MPGSHNCWAGSAMAVVALASVFPGATVANVGCHTDADCPYGGPFRCCGTSLHAENCPDFLNDTGLPCVLPGTAGATTCSCQTPITCGDVAYPPATPGMRQVLLIGDSISHGIASPAAALGKQHNLQVVHIQVNGANVWWGSHCLTKWIGSDPGRWDAVTYNFGLHDLALDNERLEPATLYSTFLANITKQLLQTVHQSKIGWVTTTPVPVGIDGYCNKSTGKGGCPPRRNTDPPIYNAAAAKVVDTIGNGRVSTIDFYSHVVQKCGSPQYTLCPNNCTETLINGSWVGDCYQIPQNVHYRPAGWNDLSQLYISAVLQLLH